MQAELVDKHKTLMWEEFQSLLDADRDEGEWTVSKLGQLLSAFPDLQRMYSLLVLIPDGLDPLRTKFEAHVERVGKAAVERVIPAPGAVGETGKAEVLVCPAAMYQSGRD